MLSYAPKREKRWKAAQEVAVASATSAAPVPDAQEKLRGLVGLFDLDDADASDVRDELAAQFERSACAYFVSEAAAVRRSRRYCLLYPRTCTDAE